MRALFASSEIFPLAKTGGLGDVSAALPKALSALGVDMQLMLPAYPSALNAAENKSIALEREDFMGAGPLRLISGRAPDTGLPIWLADCPALFRRGGGPYQDEEGQDWPDNAQRFAVFSQVAAQLSLGLLLPDWRADIVHANDWHAGLIPAILAHAPGRPPATLLTMHNLAYQGIFPAEFFPQLGLPGDCFSPEGIEFYGQISFLKAGIRYTDRLTTVSPSYAHEILTPEFAYGLEGLLQQRAPDLVGILNGADYDVWDPAADANLPANFSGQEIDGKQLCGTALRDELGLDRDGEAPLVVFVSRITCQKMADAVAEAVPAIVEAGAQCALLGDGEQSLEERFMLAARRHAGRVACRIGYEEPLAHRILAGGDILLHPARFEPCGLTQLYGMRYGTVPVVRRTGGLRDTVVDATEGSLRGGTATGFSFENATTADFIRCIRRALFLHQQSATWRRIQRQAMAQDFGWAASAQRYLAIYRELAAG
jgi:starch synthase